MNTVQLNNMSVMIDDQEALKRANALTVDAQNYEFSAEARDKQIFSGSKPGRIRLVGGHAVPMFDPEVQHESSPVVTALVEISAVVEGAPAASRTRAGRGLYGLNKKRRENNRSYNG
jgi:hypothetical protein